MQISTLVIATMNTHTTDSQQATPVTSVVTTPLPGMALGFFLGAAFVVVEIGEVLLAPQSAKEMTPFSLLIGVGGAIYWLRCVYRIHKVLAEATNRSHPISPGRGAFFNLIPFFNLYWFFRWPNEIARFVNRSSTTRMAIGWPGFFVLLGFLLGRFVDGALFLFLSFGVGSYINKKIRSALGPAAEARAVQP